MSRFQAWLDQLPTTNLRLFVNVALGVVLVLGVLALMVARIPIDNVALGILSAFLLGKSVDATNQFVQKRKTYVAPSPDSERAAVDPTTPPVAPIVPIPAAGELAPPPVPVVLTPVQPDD